MSMNSILLAGLLGGAASIPSTMVLAGSWLHQQSGYVENGSIQIDDGAGGKVNAISNSTTKSVTQIRSSQPPIVIVEQNMGELLAGIDLSKQCWFFHFTYSGAIYRGIGIGEYDSTSDLFIGFYGVLEINNIDHTSGKVLYGLALGANVNLTDLPAYNYYSTSNTGTSLNFFTTPTTLLNYNFGSAGASFLTNTHMTSNSVHRCSGENA